MALVTWTDGGLDGNLATVTNYSTGALPSAGDDLVFGDTTRAINAGLTALAALQLGSITVSGGALIGSDTAPMMVAGVTGTVTWSGTGSYFKLGTATNPVVKVKVAPRSNGTFYASTGTFTQIEGAAGLVSVESAAVVTTGLGAGSGWQIAANGTGFTTFTLAKGTATSKRSIATGEIGPGALLITQLTAAISTKVTVQPQGYFNHQSSGTVALSEVRPDGKANAQNNPYSGFTVTNRTNYVGYKENFNAETLGLTFTNGPSNVGSN